MKTPLRYCVQRGLCRNGGRCSPRAAMCLAGLWALVVHVATAYSQFKEDPPTTGPRLGAETVHRMQVGVIVKAADGPCGAIKGSCPVPIDWPEQSVRVVNEDVSPSVELQYRMVTGTVREMEISIPTLAHGQTAQALVTFEIHRRTLLPPDDVEQFRVPERPDKSLKIFLGASPYIEISNGRVRRAARDALGPMSRGEEGSKQGVDVSSGWRLVERLYDYTREKVEYRNGPLKGAAAALRDGTGDCEELTSLFIALCRLHHVPARTVWVEGHCYPEFYLENAAGEGFWFPCQAAGDRAFGEITETRPILQKGDNFRIPGRGAAMRYVSEHLTGSKLRGAVSPQVKFVRKIELGPPAR